MPRRSNPGCVPAFHIGEIGKEHFGLLGRSVRPT